MARRADRRRERGSFSIEMAALAPVLLLVIAFIVSVGRVTEARAQTQGAARDAVRAATINHNGNARQAAQQAYLRATDGHDCAPEAVLNTNVPQPGDTVTATATCYVSTLWGRHAIERTAASAVDVYRSTD